MEAEEICGAILAADLSDEQRCEGLRTVQSMLLKIRDFPGEEKYRQIRKTNPQVQRRLFPLCFELLRRAGFEDVNDQMVYKTQVPLPELDEVLGLITSIIPDAPPQQKLAKVSAAPQQHAAPKQPVNPAEAKRQQQQKREERAAADRNRAQSSAQDQLAAVRRQAQGRYQEEQDVALARHLSSLDADSPYDAISALNRGKTAMITCHRCNTTLRYSSAHRAVRVLCPCGVLLTPLHLQGEPAGRCDVIPGEPMGQDSESSSSRMPRGPTITLRGPDGEQTRVALHTVLRMVRQQEETQQHGAEDGIIQALPTRVYKASEASSETAKEDSNCQICMEDFGDGDELRTLPCFHLFHAKCVDQWLQVNSICPTCRHKVG